MPSPGTDGGRTRVSEQRVGAADETAGNGQHGAQPEASPTDAAPDRTTGPGHDAEPGEGDKSDVAALESQLRGALSDLANLRKRFDREMARQRAFERAQVAAEWLPVVDNLERALEHASASPDMLLEGVRAVRDQAVAVLGRLGYPRYEDVGLPFDPTRDEAVGTMPADAPKGTVVAAPRPGYGSPETLLRPAGVIVSSGGG